MDDPFSLNFHAMPVANPFGNKGPEIGSLQQDAHKFQVLGPQMDKKQANETRGIIRAASETYRDKSLGKSKSPLRVRFDLDQHTSSPKNYGSSDKIISTLSNRYNKENRVSGTFPSLITTLGSIANPTLHSSKMIERKIQGLQDEEFNPQQITPIVEKTTALHASKVRRSESFNS
jgi:hypothetical protein